MELLQRFRDLGRSEQGDAARPDFGTCQRKVERAHGNPQSGGHVRATRALDLADEVQCEVQATGCDRDRRAWPDALSLVGEQARARVRTRPEGQKQAHTTDGLVLLAVVVSAWPQRVHLSVAACPLPMIAGRQF